MEIYSANQNTGKPLYIRQYSTEPSHLATVFSMVQNSYGALSRGIAVEYLSSHLYLMCIPDSLRGREKLVERRVGYSTIITLESVAQSVCIPL